MPALMLCVSGALLRRIERTQPAIDSGNLDATLNNGLYRPCC
jgi:hypothetical protein